MWHRQWGLFMSQNDRSRTVAVLGAENTEKLRKARIFVAGLGGVGGYAVELLARSGVGNFVIADGDTVEASNCNRQIIALAGNIGRLKTGCWAERIKQIYPDIEVECIPEFLTPENIPGFLAKGRLDGMVDAIDSVKSKAALLAEAVRLNIPAVSAMGAGRRRELVWPSAADIHNTRNCPLARAVREELRKNYGIQKGIRAVFFDSPPESGQSSGGVLGSLACLPAAMGCMLAAEMLEMILGSDDK